MADVNDVKGMINDGDAKADESSSGARSEADDNQISQISEMISSFEPEERKSEGAKPEDKKGEADAGGVDEEGEVDTDDGTGDEGKGKEDGRPDDDIIKELRENIKELRSLLESKQSGTEKEDKDDKSLDSDSFLASQMEEIRKGLSESYIIDDDTYEEIFASREKLNGLLKTVQNETIQGMLRSIPNIIGAVIPRYVMIHTKTQEFYKNNPDLLEHRVNVGKIIDDVASKNPKWTLDEILTFVGGKDESDIGEVRRRLNLKKVAVNKAEKENIRRPSFVKPAHVRNNAGKVELKGLAKEIDDMIDATET